MDCLFFCLIFHLLILNIKIYPRIFHFSNSLREGCLSSFSLPRNLAVLQNYDVALMELCGEWWIRTLYRCQSTGGAPPMSHHISNVLMWTSSLNHFQTFSWVKAYRTLTVSGVSSIFHIKKIQELQQHFCKKLHNLLCFYLFNVGK